MKLTLTSSSGDLIMETVRLQKLLSSAGIGSRRAVEDWIREGRIMVNGKPAKLGQQASVGDRVLVDGKSVDLPTGSTVTRVLLYKKRVGELVTRSDPEGRRTVFLKLPKLRVGRWIAVGRLDINTSGLLLLTNDGELARRLTHPSFEIAREYAVRVLGDVNGALLQRLRTGVQLEDGRARFEQIVPGEAAEDSSTPTANHWFHVTVREGRNRLVRRLLESQGLRVSRLIRTGYGPIRLSGGQRSGTARELHDTDVAALCEAVRLEMPEFHSRKAECVRTPQERSNTIRGGAIADDLGNAGKRNAGRSSPTERDHAPRRHSRRSSGKKSAR